MDIANYVSELLGQHGEISVPGLGYFVHERVNAHYDEVERKFYPPGYKVKFSQQPVDGDDTLTAYIAEKKKISLASSKYFTEKYITALKQEAALQDVTFADLGQFHISQGNTTFKSQLSNGNDSQYYGYGAVSIKKINQAADPEKPYKPAASVAALYAPAEIEEAAQKPATSIYSDPAQILTADQPEEYYDEEPEKRGLGVWAIILIIVVILAAAGFAIYKYKPEWLNFTHGEEMQLPAEPKAKPVLKVDTIKQVSSAPVDSAAKAVIKPDSTLNKPVVATDTATKPVFAIFVGSFKTKTMSQRQVNMYKSTGVDARIYSGAGTGPRIKIIVGSFATPSDAEAERHRLIASKKIQKDSYIQPIKTQK